MRELSSFSTITGRTMSWKSTETEDIHTLEQLLHKTLDGGRCSNTMVVTSMLSSTRTNTLTFKAKLIQKEDISNVTRLRMDKSTSNGMSSMLMNGRVNPPRESSMKNMDFMSKEISISSQP